jgi:hypothetical protein
MGEYDSTNRIIIYTESPILGFILICEQITLEHKLFQKFQDSQLMYSFRSSGPTQALAGP